PLALLGGGLLHDDELGEPREHEDPVLLELLVPNGGEGLEEAGDVFARQLFLVSVRNSLDDLGLGQPLRHVGLLFDCRLSTWRRETPSACFSATNSREKDRPAKQKTA